MEWFIAVLAILVLGVAAIAAAGGMGEMSREPVRDVYRQQLPERPLTADDLRRARFGVTLRGYSMAQVDDLLDRLGAEIEARDARIAELIGHVRPTAPIAPDMLAPDAAFDPLRPDGHRPVDAYPDADRPEDWPPREHAEARPPQPPGSLHAGVDGTAHAPPEPIGQRAAGWAENE